MGTSTDLGGAIHVSIDVSKHSLDVCILPDGESFAVSNDRTGTDSLLDQLRLSSVESVVLEASSRYERSVAAALVAAEIALAVVNPL